MLEEGPDQHHRSPAAEANGARPRKRRKEQKRQKKDGDGDTEVASGSMTEDRRCDQLLSCGPATETNVACLRAHR